MPRMPCGLASSFRHIALLEERNASAGDRNRAGRPSEPTAARNERGQGCGGCLATAKFGRARCTKHLSIVLKRFPQKGLYLVTPCLRPWCNDIEMASVVNVQHLDILPLTLGDGSIMLGGIRCQHDRRN